MLSINNYGAGVSHYYENRRMKTLGERIKHARTQAKLSQADLGRVFKISREAVSLWEGDTNAPTMDKIGRIAQATHVSVDWLLTGNGMSGPVHKVPVIVYIGAGAEIYPIDDYPQGGSVEKVDPPPGVVGPMVAGVIRGDSMHPLKDGWLIFWAKDQDGVPEECLGRLCVVQVKDGSTMVKEVHRGARKGLYNLLSWNAPARQDVRLDWASRIIDIRPR